MKEITALDLLLEVESKLKFIAAMLAAWDCEVFPPDDSDFGALSLILSEISEDLDSVLKSAEKREL